MSEIATKVIAIVVDKLGVEESQVTPEASFTGDLGADSTFLYQMIKQRKLQLLVMLLHTSKTQQNNFISLWK